MSPGPLVREIHFTERGAAGDDPAAVLGGVRRSGILPWLAADEGRRTSEDRMAKLQVESRERASSAEVRRLRSKGILPMALIEKGKGTRLIQAQRKAVGNVLRQSKGVAVFGLSVDTEPKEISVVVKDVQRDAISRGIIHLTLQEVKEDDVIRMRIPIVTVGEADAVKNHRSTMMIPLMSLEVMAKASDLPENFTLDVSELGDNDKITVGDIVLPEGVKTNVAADMVVVTTSPIRIVEEEPEVKLDEHGEPIVAVEGEEGEEGAAAEGEATTDGEGAADAPTKPK